MSYLTFKGVLLLWALSACSFSADEGPVSSGLKDGSSESSAAPDLTSHIKEKAVLLENASHLDYLIDTAAHARLVLLGEASHGTHEYYAWRDSVSRRLIAERDFDFIVVEGDFASLYELNRYVKHLPGAASSAREVLKGLDRWPLWMWGNQEVLHLAEWLRDYNENRPPEKRAGFYGMDVYDEWRSMEQVLTRLKEDVPQLYEEVKELYSCMMPYKGDSWGYAGHIRQGQEDCSRGLAQAVEVIEDNSDMFDNPRDYFYVLQNAYVLKNAERFYRKSALGQQAQSWNARATHMFETAQRLSQLYGEDSKGIVWAHNTHIGDAGYTSMRQQNQVNIGQLSRRHMGVDQVFLIGFTTYQGTVKAGAQWGEARQKMKIPPAVDGSIEATCYETGLPAFYMVFDEKDRHMEAFMEPMGNRAVGVVYNPRNDPRQFVPTIVPMRYDALVFFRQTKALKPLQD